MPCKRTLNTRPIMIKRPTLQNLKKQNMYTSYSRKADHQGSKIPFTEFRWIGPYIIEKVLPNNIYLVRKIGINKTEVLHRMRMRQFTPRQPPADIAVKPQQYKSDPEVSLHHDDLYARAWEYAFEQPIFDAENDKAAPPNLQEIPVQFDYSTVEMRNTPGNPHVCSPEIFPCTDEVSDVTDMCPHMEPDVESSPDQPQNSPPQFQI